jgi:hypothetical protein
MSVPVERERRIAENEITFRDANERIRRALDRLGGFDGMVPFICECAQEHCSEVVRLALGEYERVRANARAFLCAPGHETTDDLGTVVFQNDRYCVSVKDGLAGEIAEAADPR